MEVEEDPFLEPVVEEEPFLLVLFLDEVEEVEEESLVFFEEVEEVPFLLDSELRDESSEDS